MSGNGFIAARVVFLACYLADWATLRSIAWFGGIACAVMIFIAGS